MSRQPPRLFRMVWRDGTFVPEGRTALFCNDEFGEGEVVSFERHEERSTVSHNHYFACIQEGWNNLPEKDERFPNPDSLRKWALIRNGYCTESSIVCSSPEQAHTVAAFMGYTEGVIIVVRESVVKRYIAKSQSLKAMNKQEFQQSKDVVLDTIAELIRVKRSRLEKAGEQA